MKLKATNIKYDLEGSVPPHQVKEVLETLPKVIYVETTLNCAEEDELEELISDEITNQTGYCHKGFQWDYVDEELEKLLKDVDLLLSDNNGTMAAFIAFGLISKNSPLYPGLKDIKDRNDAIKDRIQKFLKGE